MPIYPAKYTSPFFRFFEESSTAMAIADKSGIIQSSNGEFARMMRTLSGITETKPVWNISDSLEFLSINDSIRFANLLGRLSSGTRKIDFRAPFQDSEKNIHWFKIHAWTISETQGVDLGVRGPFIGLIITDETVEQKAEEKLLEDKQIAEKAMEAKDLFLANMSHEIRTPIQTIIGMTGLLEETKLDQEQGEYSKHIQFSADMLLSLINDILDYSKIESGKMELEYISFDLAENIEQVVQMICLEAHKKGLEIAVDIPGTARRRIMGDPGKFRQIVINLVKNAVKFTEQGTVTISARISDGESIIQGEEDVSPVPGRALTVSVIDTGIGIPEESRDRLFTSFQQADNSHTRRFGGTGLGLAISRSLVELMKGKITMVPREEGGSVFRFTIPIEGAAEQPPPLSGPAGAGSMSILVVDDTTVSSRITASYLRELGFARVDTAASGKEALEKMRTLAAENSGYNMCLVDVTMPNMDGWHLAAEINGDKSINSAWLILMVPNGFLETDAKMTLLKWFDDYIYKPVLFRKLAQAVSVLEEQTGKASPDEAETPLEDPADLVVPADIIPPSAVSGPEQESARQMPQERGSPQESARTAPFRVLVVEDHEVNQHLFAIILEKMGMIPILASDGIEGVEQVKKTSLDLIFMDIQMPRMNGYEAASEIRRLGYSMPIIAVTAGIQRNEREQCLEAGFSDLLFKPFKKPDIEAMVEKWKFNQDRRRQNRRRSFRRRNDAAGPGDSKSKDSNPKDSNPKDSKNKTAAGEKQIFNSREALETFMNHDEVLKPLLHRFLERSAIQTAALPELERLGEWDEARRLAHTIKGSALTLSGKELGSAAARLERAYKNRDKEAAAAAGPLFREALSCFTEAVENFLKQTHE